MIKLQELFRRGSCEKN